MGVFYPPAQSWQFTAIFQSAVVATRPQMSCRLAPWRWEGISPHALGRRYEGQNSMKALASAQVERTRRKSARCHSFICLVWLDSLGTSEIAGLDAFCSLSR